MTVPEQYGYVGLVGAFTAPIVMIAYTSGEYGDIAIARIEMTCYGVAIWVMISFFVFPGLCDACRSAV